MYESSQGEKGVGLTVPGRGMDEGGNIKDERIFPFEYVKQSAFCESPLLLRSEPAVANYFLIKEMRRCFVNCSMSSRSPLVKYACHLRS